MTSDKEKRLAKIIAKMYHIKYSDILKHSYVLYFPRDLQTCIKYGDIKHDKRYKI